MMNVLQAAGLAGLGQYQKDVQKTRTDIKASVEKEVRTLVKSQKFYRVIIATNSIASPIKAKSDGPIVADINRTKIGGTPSGSFTPKVIVVSGQTTFRKAHAIQEPRIQVWLGELAAKALKIDVSNLEELEIKAHCTLLMKDGQEHTMAAAHTKFKEALASGYKPDINAKSPEGWEGTVERMKNNHPEIDNPWALAHWMKNEGYTPSMKATEDVGETDTW